MTSQPRAGAEFSGLLASPDQISPLDVRYLRLEVFRDGVVSRQEAEAVFAMNNIVPRKCDKWNEFFVHALTDHVVNQVEPHGYVTVEDADWLIDMVSHDGRVETATELELLINILSKAQSTPERLVAFVLEEIGNAAIEGDGPLAHGRALEPGVIGEAETELIRQVMYAYGGDDGIAISKTEAEILFAINELTLDSANHPAWRELFVRAIANYLMAGTAYSAPSRDEALAREAWLADTGIDVGGVLKQTFSSFGSLFSKGFMDGILDDAHTRLERAWKARNERFQQATAECEKITDAEADWLVDKLRADEIIDENERALLDFIRIRNPEIHDDLGPPMEQKSA